MKTQFILETSFRMVAKIAAEFVAELLSIVRRNLM